MATIKYAKVLKGYKLQAYTDPLTERFSVRVEEDTGKGFTPVFSETTLNISQTSAKEVSGLYQFETDLNIHKLDPHKRYTFQVAASDAAGKALTPFILANADDVNPPRKAEGSWWAAAKVSLMIVLVVVCISGLIACGYKVYKKVQGKEKLVQASSQQTNNVGASVSNGSVVSEAPKVSQAILPTGGIPTVEMPPLMGAPKKEVPAAPAVSTNAPVIVTNGKTNTVVPSPGGTINISNAGPIMITYGNNTGNIYNGTSGGGSAQQPALQWPDNCRPQGIASILGAEMCDDPRVNQYKIPCELPAGVDMVYRYPHGWYVDAQVTDQENVKEAFNLGSDENAQWILVTAYKGQPIGSLRLCATDGRPHTVTFTLTRLNK